MQIWVGDLLMVINSPAFQWHSWRIGLSFWAWAQQVSVFILYNLFFSLSFLSLFTCQAFLGGLLSTMACWALLSRVVYCSLDMKGQWNGHFNQLTAAWSKIPSSWLWLLFKVFFFIYNIQRGFWFTRCDKVTALHRTVSWESKNCFWSRAGFNQGWCQSSEQLSFAPGLMLKAGGERVGAAKHSQSGEHGERAWVLHTDLHPAPFAQGLPLRREKQTFNLKILVEGIKEGIIHMKSLSPPCEYSELERTRIIKSTS